MKRAIFSIAICVVIFTLSSTAMAMDPLKKVRKDAQERVEVCQMDQRRLVQSAEQLSKALQEGKDIVISSLGIRIFMDLKIGIQNEEFAYKEIQNLRQAIQRCSLSSGCLDAKQLSDARDEASRLQSILNNLAEPSELEANLLKAQAVVIRLIKEEKERAKFPVNDPGTVWFIDPRTNDRRVFYNLPPNS